MRAGPVDLAALAAALEENLGSEDVRGHPIPYFFGGDIQQHGITANAPGQQTRQLGNPDRAENMPELILNLFAFQKDELPNRPSDQKPGVAREQDPPVTAGKFQEFLVMEAIGIEDVEACDAQPFRQSAQHDIGDEPGGGRPFEVP